MKVTYFDHYLVNQQQHPFKRLKADWDPLLKAFSKSAPEKVRLRFKSMSGESLFLFWVTDRTYLFVVTRSNEIIKAVNSKDFKCEDILSKLEKNEVLGFASYLFVEKWYVGIGSTIFGPKSTSVFNFLNEILRQLNLQRLQLFAEPFAVSMTSAQARHLEYVGNVRISVDPNSSLFRLIAAQVGLLNPDQTQGLEIVLKAAPYKNMADDFKQIVDGVNDEELKSYVVHGKEALTESAMDFFLVGNGAVSDSIPSKDEAKLRKLFAQKAKDNARLAKELVKLKEDDRYEEMDIADFVHYSKSSNWAGLGVDE